ncbi:unnamed protein product, partial [Cladocopium goreaui]
TIPNRNSLLIAGDLNCSAELDGPHVGFHFSYKSRQSTGFTYQQRMRCRLDWQGGSDTWESMMEQTGNALQEICANSDSNGALQMTRDFVERIWAGAEAINLGPRDPPGVPLSIADIEFELQRLPHNKSVASPCIALQEPLGKCILGTSYCVEQAGETVVVETSKGVRQGCRAVQVPVSPTADNGLEVRPCDTGLDLDALLREEEEQRILRMHQSLVANLLNKPYGEALLDIVRRRDWAALVDQRSACQDLANQCCVCDFHFTRPQELHSHMRVHHPKWIPHTFTKGSQLCKGFASNSPCRYCNKSFKQAHSCPILTQLGMLLIHLPSETDQQEDPPSAALRCEICGLQAATLDEIHSHLANTHRLAFHDWQPERDLMGRDPACNHCATPFASVSAVRQHVTLGQCREFDPHRSPSLLPISPEIQLMMQTGDFHPLLQDPMKRMRLTLHCAQCGVTYSRSNDLMLHLQTAHSAMWNQAQAMTKFLVKVLAPIHACVCNPSVNKFTLTHVCPFYRQMAMLWTRSSVELLLPWLSDKGSLTTLMQRCHLHAACQSVIEAIHARQLKRLLQESEMNEFLRSHCVLCGGAFHPALLRDHLIQVHASSLTRLYDILHFLYDTYMKVAHTDYQCAQCNQIFNLPLLGDPTLAEQHSRQTLVLAHFQQCKETQELMATFSAMAPLLAQHNQKQKEDERGPKKAKTQHRPPQEEPAQALPQVVMQMAKLLIRLDADQNLLRKQDSFVFYMQMEPESVIHVLTARAKAWHHEMSQETPMKTQEWKPLRVTLMHHLAMTLQQRLQKLYACQPTDALFQKAMEHHLLNAKGEFFFQRWDPTSRKLTQTDQAPIPMDRMRRYMDQLVETTQEAGNILKFHSLKASGEQAVTPWLLQISLRCDDLQVLLETLSGNKVWRLLRAAMSNMVLHNDRNDCFINAAVTATLWTFLSRSDFEPSFLGPQATLIAESVLGDPVEFISHVLRGMRFEGFDMTWERRVQINDTVRVMDQSAADRPLTVQFDLMDIETSPLDYTSLQTMLNSWSSQYGMHTALKARTPLLCIHVDRYINQGSEAAVKSERPIHFWGAIDVPFFADDELQIDTAEYQILAAVSHSGMDSAGHCRALLTTWPTEQPPISFLLVDDDQPPQRLRAEPEWFKRDVMCLWFCHSDYLDLFHMTDPLQPHPIDGPSTSDSEDATDPDNMVKKVELVQEAKAQRITKEANNCLRHVE